MLANNELGTLQPVAELAALCRKRRIPVLCDAVQAVGKLEVNVKTLGVDYLVLGGHKFHAPPGVGALWIRPKAPIRPLIYGAPQERGLRASTENVPAIVGLGAASSIARDDLDERYNYLRRLRDRFEKGLQWIEGVGIHCQGSARLPNTSHIALHGRSGHEAMLWLDSRRCAVSTGSACHSGKPQASRVLRQMGLDEPEALSSLRVSFGMTNTEDEVDNLLRVAGARRIVVVGQLRAHRRFGELIPLGRLTIASPARERRGKPHQVGRRHNAHHRVAADHRRPAHVRPREQVHRIPERRLR